jgi:maleamate amidohydrolase
VSERIWERFLTEQDKRHLANSRPKTPYGFGRRAAVLSVDNYRAAIGDEPMPLLQAIELWPNSTGEAGWEALAHIAELLAHARRAAMPIIHVTGLAEEDSGIPGWSARRGGRGAKQRDPAAQDRHQRRYDIAPQAAPLPGEVVLRKTAPSAFFGTPLLAHLVSEGIDTLIVVGEAVSGCVRATVVDGCSYRLNMIVVEECTYDRHEASRAINLFDMDQKYADVISIREAVQYIDGVVATPPNEPDTGSGSQHAQDHSHTDGQPHADGTEHSHAHHSHQEDDRSPVRLPGIVLRAVPDGAQLREVCEHAIHGRVIERAGDEVIRAASASMIEGFTSSQHVVVRVTAGDLEPDDDPRLAAAVTMSAGGVLLIGIGFEPPVHDSRSRTEGAAPPAGAACPECGNTDVDVVEASAVDGRPTARLLGCPECSTVWDAGP